MSLLQPTKSSAKFQPQLPVAWYVDADIFDIEQKILFPQTPQYIGHELMVPNAGDYFSLEWMNHAKALINNHDSIELVSNLCRHRQALMLKGQGNSELIVCPLHRWTYNLRGELIGAPHFKEKPCYHLNITPLQNWNGLLFKHGRDIAKDLQKLGYEKDFDFSGYKLDRVMIEKYDFNWKTFIEVYLEDYHVAPFHPGLNNFVDCDHLNWEMGKNFSVQTVGVKKALRKSGSAIYQNWQQQVLQYDEQLPKHGAIWMAYYPFLMLEWYPNVLVVSHIIPRGVDACSNVVEFYYPENIVLHERAFIEAQQAAYQETAVEDKEICQRMHDGRRALFELGEDERGPYQYPMESGLEHFHLWLRDQLEPHLPEAAR